MKLERNVVISAALALIIGLGIGHYTAGNASAATTRSGFGGGTRVTFQGRGGNQANAGFVAGSIAKMDSESVTLSTRDGSSHLILFTPDTSVLKSVEGTTTDLKIGQDVVVTGSTNSDGSVSAQTIQIRPAGSPSAPGTNAPMIPAPRLQ